MGGWAWNVLSDPQASGPPAELPRGKRHLCWRVPGEAPRRRHGELSRAGSGPRPFRVTVAGRAGLPAGNALSWRSARLAAGGGGGRRTKGFLGTMSRLLSPAVLWPDSCGTGTSRELGQGWRGGWLQPVWPASQANPLECGRASGWSLWGQDSQPPNACLRPSSCWFYCPFSWLCKWSSRGRGLFREPPQAMRATTAHRPPSRQRQTGDL